MTFRLVDQRRLVDSVNDRIAELSRFTGYRLVCCPEIKPLGIHWTAGNDGVSDKDAARRDSDARARKAMKRALILFISIIECSHAVVHKHSRAYEHAHRYAHVGGPAPREAIKYL